MLDTGYGLSDSINIRTDVGDIEVHLPAHSMGTLNASTDTGNIDVNFEAALSHEILAFSRKHDTLRAIFNGNPEPALEMHADVGDIDLKFYQVPR